jgi:hypothetical protein
MAQAPKKAKRAKKKKAAKPLAAAAAAPGSAAMATARTVVIGVLRKRFGDIPLPDDLLLNKLKFNPMNLAGLAQNIRDAGVPVNNAPIQVCKKIIDVIVAVARVIEGKP